MLTVSGARGAMAISIKKKKIERGNSEHAEDPVKSHAP
jgi:hypothetical protein